MADEQHAPTRGPFAETTRAYVARPCGRTAASTSTPTAASPSAAEQHPPAADSHAPDPRIGGERAQRASGSARDHAEQRREDERLPHHALEPNGSGDERAAGRQLHRDERR